MLGIGFGFALCFPAVNAQATSGIADREQGLASGLVNTSIQIGGAVVLAVVTAVLNGAGSASSAHGELLPGMRSAIAVVAGVAAVGAVGAVIRLRYLARTAPAAVQAEEPVVEQLAQEAA
jgi:sugar phosphate permease